MERKISVSIGSFLMVYALMAMPLAVTHVLTVYNAIVFLFSLFGFYLLGAVLLLPAKIAHLLLPLNHTAVSIFFGGLAYSLILFICNNAVADIALLALLSCLLLFVFRKHTDWVFKLEPTSIFAFFVAVALLFLISSDLLSSGDLSKQFTAFQDGSYYYTNDRYFNTSLVVSIRHGSIFNAAYEAGSPLNYQILGFLFPSLLANMLGISSHQALWGMSLPFYKLLSVLSAYELCYFLLKDKVSRNNYWFIFLALSFPILLAPLHPLYILKGVVGSFIFNGIGYLVPSGTITYPVTIFISLFSFLLFSKIDWQAKKVSADKISFTVCLSLVVLGKIPFYGSFMVFIGTIVLKRIIMGKERLSRYMPYFLCSLVITAVLFKVCYAQYTGGRDYFKYGYLAELFGGRFKRSSAGVVNNIVIVMLLLGIYVLWMGIRLLGLASLFKSKNPRLNEIFTGAIASLLGITLLASFLRMEITDSKGNTIMDGSFDVEQFLRSSFYVLTIAATIGMLHLIYFVLANKKYKALVFAFTGIWCCLSFSALISYFFDKEGTHAPNAWYNDNLRELKSGKYDDGLIAVNPSATFFGIMLASSDYGKYWAAMDHSLGNDNCSIKNEYRWVIFKHLLADPKEEDLIKMKNEGVKYIISTPTDSARISEISTLFPQHIHKVNGAGWIYGLY